MFQDASAACLGADGRDLEGKMITQLTGRGEGGPYLLVLYLFSNINLTCVYTG